MKIGFTIGKFAPLHKRTPILDRKGIKGNGQVLCNYI